MNMNTKTKFNQIASWNEEWLSLALVEGPFPSMETPQYLKKVVVTRLMELTNCDQTEANLVWDDATSGEETALLHVAEDRCSASICFDGDHIEYIVAIPYPEMER